MAKISTEIFLLESIGETEKDDLVLFPSNYIVDNLDKFGDLIILSIKSISGNVNCQILRIENSGILNSPIYVSKNVLNKLRVNEGDIVEISPSNIKKGKFIKLKPFKREFCTLDNPKEALEKELMKYTILNKTDHLVVEGNGNSYGLIITEMKDITDKDVDSMIINNTDLNVDFDTPMDYVEPLRRNVIKSNSKPKIEEKKFNPFSGRAYSLK